MKEREGYKSEQIRNEAFAFVKLNTQQRRVLEVIKKWQPISSEIIAEHLGVFPHVVTPRVLELREMGIITYAGESCSKTSNRKVSLWEINKDGRQLDLFGNKKII